MKILEKDEKEMGLALRKRLAQVFDPYEKLTFTDLEKSDEIQWFCEYLTSKNFRMSYENDLNILKDIRALFLVKIVLEPFIRNRHNLYHLDYSQLDLVSRFYRHSNEKRGYFHWIKFDLRSENYYGVYDFMEEAEGLHFIPHCADNKFINSHIEAVWNIMKMSKANTMRHKFSSDLVNKIVYLKEDIELEKLLEASANHSRKVRRSQLKLGNYYVLRDGLKVVIVHNSENPPLDKIKDIFKVDVIESGDLREKSLKVFDYQVSIEKKSYLEKVKRKNGKTKIVEKSNSNKVSVKLSKNFIDEVKAEIGESLQLKTASSSIASYNAKTNEWRGIIAHAKESYQQCKELDRYFKTRYIKKLKPDESKRNPIPLFNKTKSAAPPSRVNFFREPSLVDWDLFKTFWNPYKRSL